MVSVTKTFLPLNTRGGNSKIPVVGCKYQYTLTSITIDYFILLIMCLCISVGTYTIADENIILNVLDVALGAGYRLIGKFILC